MGGDFEGEAAGPVEGAGFGGVVADGADGGVEKGGVERVRPAVRGDPVIHQTEGHGSEAGTEDDRALAPEGFARPRRRVGEDSAGAVVDETGRVAEQAGRAGGVPGGEGAEKGEVGEGAVAEGGAEAGGVEVGVVVAPGNIAALAEGLGVGAGDVEAGADEGDWGGMITARESRATRRG